MSIIQLGISLSTQNNTNPPEIPDDNNPQADDTSIWNGLDIAYRIYNSSLNRNKYMPRFEPIDIPKYDDSKYENFEFSKFDIKSTEEKIKNSIKNIESLSKQKIITKEDISKMNNQTQMIMHNLIDDVEDLSVQTINLPDILTQSKDEISANIN